MTELELKTKMDAEAKYEARCAALNVTLRCLCCNKRLASAKTRGPTLMGYLAAGLCCECYGYAEWMTQPSYKRGAKGKSKPRPTVYPADYTGRR